MSYKQISEIPVSDAAKALLMLEELGISPNALLAYCEALDAVTSHAESQAEFLADGDETPYLMADEIEALWEGGLDDARDGICDHFNATLQWAKKMGLVPGGDEDAEAMAVEAADKAERRGVK